MIIYLAITLVVVVAFAAAILWYGFRQQTNMSEALESLISRVKGAASLLSGVEYPAAFAQRFDDIDHELRALPAVGAAWQDYRTYLVRDPRSGEVAATRSPLSFFDDRLAYRAETDMRSFDAVPGRLIAIGLCVTFLGLTVSLAFAAAGLVTEDIDQTRTALLGLLWSSAIKFITSIVAIAASIFFVRRRNALLRELDRALEALVAHLERLVPPSRVELIAQDMLLEMSNQGEFTRDRDERLSTAIADQLGATLPETLRQAVAPLAEAVREMSADMGRVNEQALRKMLEGFAEQLRGAAGEHSEKMTAMLDQVARTVEAVPRHISESSARFSEAMTSATEHLQAVTERTGDILGKALETSSHRIARSADALAGVAAQLETTAERVNTTEGASIARIEAADQTLNKAVDRVQALLATADRTLAALSPVVELATTLDAASKVLHEAVSGMSGFVQTARNSMVQSQAAAEKLSASAERYAAETSSLDNSLAAVFSQMGKGIDVMRSRVDDTLDKIDQDAAEILHRVGIDGRGT
ncbi:MAG TPA: hypothetical protein VE891_03540 [Allosphingosinicella sp.]|nr:hypothetical protein [Allosphingosinicella sp.]